MYTTPAPTAAQRTTARALSEQLRAFPNTPLELPEEVRQILNQVLLELAKGHALALLPLEEDLTTQQAADVLGVSRPLLISLLEDGHIPFRKVGTHRRVRLEDVMAFKAENKRKRLEVLAELTAQAQEWGMGY
jgi:excisionase family DNA binding protein